jgi:hypothetical protein
VNFDSLIIFKIDDPRFIEYYPNSNSKFYLIISGPSNLKYGSIISLAYLPGISSSVNWKINSWPTTDGPISIHTKNITATKAYIFPPYYKIWKFFMKHRQKLLKHQTGSANTIDCRKTLPYFDMVYPVSKSKEFTEDFDPDIEFEEMDTSIIRQICRLLVGRYTIHGLEDDILEEYRDEKVDTFLLFNVIDGKITPFTYEEPEFNEGPEADLLYHRHFYFTDLDTNVGTGYFLRTMNVDRLGDINFDPIRDIDDWKPTNSIFLSVDKTYQKEQRNFALTSKRFFKMIYDLSKIFRVTQKYNTFMNLDYVALVLNIRRIEEGEWKIFNKRNYFSRMNSEEHNIQQILSIDDKSVNFAKHICCNIMMQNLSLYTSNSNESIQKVISACHDNLSYIYFQIKANFPIDFSSSVVDNDRPYELDLRLAVKLFEIYMILCPQERINTPNQNIMQSNHTDNLLFPSYLRLLKTAYKSIKSMFLKKQTYHLDDFEGDGVNKEEVMGYFERCTSHVEIRAGDGTLETRYFLIPTWFLGLGQEKKDEMWMLFNKDSSETLWLSIMQDHFHICNEFNALEKVNKKPVVGYFSRNYEKLSRLLEHLIVFINILVLISQGSKEDGEIRLGSLSKSSTIALILTFGSFSLLLGMMMLFTSFVIMHISMTFPKDNRDWIDPSQQDPNSWYQTWREKQITWFVVWGNILKKEWALLLTILFSIFGYVDTTLFSGCLIFIIARQK